MKMVNAKNYFWLLGLVSLSANAVDLNFENRSSVSIPLQIPSVMNPNLSPNSKSGVTLREGQEVFFNYQGKKTLLLKVENEKDGEVVVIDQLIAKRVAELEKR
jgi:hypothetical protein